MADTQQIKDRVDIVQLIQEYLPLKKAGANWKANCPFHKEKSPSFMVHPEKQIWHCFGCSKGGDIFSFIQEIEGIDFVESLKLLADRAGVKLEVFKNEIDKSQKNRLMEINKSASNFFHKFLTEMPQSKSALEYLMQRGLKKETIIEWQIGFVPSQWELLTKYLLKKGFGIEDLVSAGLVIKRDGADANTGRGFYDRFRGRIMFPIWDVHDNVVGFTGRILVETENSGGKYINTPQTLVYDKSRIIFGLNKAKMEIKSKDFVILVEGQMDVIANHQAGIKNVVASSGTALTIEQIKLLKRYTNNILIAFDGDSAGQAAGKRGSDLAMLRERIENKKINSGGILIKDSFVEEGMNVKIIQIPEGAGKDADECLKKNPEIWFDSIKNAKGVMDWYFDIAMQGFDKNNPKSKQEVAQNLLEKISKIPYAVERDEWLKKVSEILNIDSGILREEIKNVKKIPQIKKIKEENIDKTMGLKSGDNKDMFKILSERLSEIFIKFPEIYIGFFSSVSSDYFFKTDDYSLYDLLNNHYNSNERDSIDLRTFLGLKNIKELDILILKADKEFDGWKEKEVNKEAEYLIDKLHKEWLKNRRREMQELMKEAENKNNKEEVEKLLEELQQL